MTKTYSGLLLAEIRCTCKVVTKRLTWSEALLRDLHQIWCRCASCGRHQL